MKFSASRAFPFGLIASAGMFAGCAHDRVLPLPQPLLVEKGTPFADRKPPKTQVPSEQVVRVSALDPAAPTSAVSQPAPARAFTPESALQFALENNPALQAVREQRGFAQGGVVMARTYPYNPVAQFQFFGVTGNDVTNRLSQAHKITMDVEIRHQREFRKQAAYAALSRTEWDIATQELLVAVAANRAFNTVLYRQRKMDVLDDTIKLNEQTVEQVKKLVDLGKLRPADLILAKTELDAAGAGVGQGRTAIAFARADLRRQFGSLDDAFVVRGDLELPLPTTEFDALSAAALDKRPDLQSRKLAVGEAQARYRLQVADRFGNPNVGPAYDFNETRNSFIGIQIGGPIPVFNRKTGEIMQAQATFARALAEVHQFEVQSAQDVQAALARYAEARKWAERYSKEVLPNLSQAVKDMNKLLEQNEPGVDVLKVIGVQRNYLTAFSAYLDALYEVSQARSDLAAAVGDPALAVGLYATTQPAAPPPAPKPLVPEPPAPLPAPAPAKESP